MQFSQFNPQQHMTRSPNYVPTRDLISANPGAMLCT